MREKLAPQCPDGRELIAREVALGQPNGVYVMLTDGAKNCSVGKIPPPPLHENNCDEIIETKDAIDVRIKELKDEGVV